MSDYPIPIYLDGVIKNAGLDELHSLSPGIVKGKGVFETMRGYRDKIFSWEEHTKRLMKGLRFYSIPLPIPLQSLRRIIGQLIARQRIGHARIRVMIWATRKKLRISVVCQKLYPLRPSHYRQGACVLVFPTPIGTRKDAHLKMIHYSFFQRAFQAALLNGCDEAILLNKKNEITEASRSNIFLVKDSVLLTPSVQCGCMEGVTRGIILKRADSLGIRCRRTRIKPEILPSVDEIFLTNSIIGVMPVKFIKNNTYHKSFAGPITTTVFDDYNKLLHKSLGIKNLPRLKKFTKDGS